MTTSHLLEELDLAGVTTTCPASSFCVGNFSFIEVLLLSLMILLLVGFPVFVDL